MEKFSEIISRTRYDLNIPVLPFLFDHRFMDGAVLPAVWSLELLAKSTLSFYPEIDIRGLYFASFDRFISINPGEKSIPCFNEIEERESGELTARLCTLVSSKSGISRAKEHIRVVFLKEKIPDNTGVSKPFCTGPENSFFVDRNLLYRELVPFGPSFRNILELRLRKEEAWALLCGGIDPGPETLGSPFPLDAAFHAACAWGQRFAGFVPFPVAFEKRIIYLATKPGQEYCTVVKPVQKNKKELVFNLIIADMEGNVHEEVTGLIMKDVSAGRLKAPAWIMEGE